MSLAEAPLHAPWRIALTGPDDGAAREKYASAGVSIGRHARILARYPAVNPRYLEVELDGERVVTLPVSIAEGYFVEPVGARAGG